MCSYSFQRIVVLVSEHYHKAINGVSPVRIGYHHHHHTEMYFFIALNNRNLLTVMEAGGLAL